MYKVLLILLCLVAATAAPAQENPALASIADVPLPERQENPVIYRKHNPAAAFALRNNLASDATGTMNLGLEIPLGAHMSLAAGVGFKSWDRFLMWDNDAENYRKWRHLTITPELRYYFTSPLNGHFLGADALYIHYNMGALKLPFGLYPATRDQRIQGDFVGGGLFYGYIWPLSNHWRIEALIGASAGWYNYNAYECPQCGQDLGRYSGATILPRLGVNIVYSFLKKQ